MRVSRRRRRRTSNRRRRRRRNAWFGDRAGHKRAACKGVRRKRRRRRRSRCRNRGVASNPRRRRRRRRNRGVAMNPRRRRRRRSRRRNTGRRRSYNRRRRRRRSRRRNPNGAASLRSPMKALTAGFNVKTLTDAGVIVGGALGNAAATGAIGSFLPPILATGPGSYATGLVSAGILGFASQKVLPRQAGKIYFGAVLEVVTRAVKEYIVPLIPGMSGMGDYLTRTNVAEARPLGYLGDYLSRQNAAEARPLGDYYGESHISEELAGY